MQGQVLKRLMRDNKMSQTSLAEHLGVSQKTISRWITGEYPIPANRIEQLRHIFKVSKSTFSAKTDLDEIESGIRALISKASGVPEIKRALETALDVCIIYNKIN